MSKKIVSATDNPEWTKEKFARSVRLEGLPTKLQQMLSTRKCLSQTSPKKVPVSISLSSDVAEGLQAMGDGWQGRADDALRAWIRRELKQAKG